MIKQTLALVGLFFALNTTLSPLAVAAEEDDALMNPSDEEDNMDPETDEEDIVGSDATVGDV